MFSSAFVSGTDRHITATSETWWVTWCESERGLSPPCGVRSLGSTTP